MKRSTQRGLTALMLALSSASCSIVVNVDLPKEGDDSDCAFLNTSQPVGVTDCVRWQFNAATLACELGPLDTDNDGFFPIACLEPDGPTRLSDIDCNDDINSGGATTFPRAPELCDGADNDCDSMLDEGVLAASLSDGPTITFTADPADLSAAVDPVAANSVGVAYSLPGLSPVPAVTVRPRDFGSAVTADRFAVATADANSTTAVAVDPAAILSRGIGIAALGGNAYAVAFINSTGGRKRLVAGVATEDRPKAVSMETSVFADGLPCTASDGDCSTTRPPVDRPVVGVSGADVLVTSVRQMEITPACDAAATAVTVVGNALIRRDFTRVTLPGNGGQVNFPALRPTVANPLGIDVGVMRSDASPAVIGIDGARFVVALPQLDNTILLRTVTVTDGVYAVAADRDVSLSVGADDLPLLEPSLALSAAVDDDDDASTPPRSALAVAFTQGCGGAGAVKVSFFNVNPATAAKTVTSRSGAPVTVDAQGLPGSISEGRPSVSFAGDQDNTWIVVFAKRKGWQARVISFDGRRHGGDASYPLSPDSDSIGSSPVAFGMPSGGFDSPRYGAMFIVNTGGVGGMYTAQLACLGADE